MTEKELNTREKIMSIAHGLFAKKGYDAVSIREISKEADVNVSAINYHFENKLGLYQSVIEFSIGSMVYDLEQIYEKSEGKDISKYVASMFDYFIEHENKLMSSFKVFMSMSEVLKDIDSECLNEGKPPGAENLEKLLALEVPDVKDEDRDWVVRSISSLVFHKAIIACNKCVVDSKEKIGITKDVLKSDLIRSTRVLVDSLK